MSRTRMRTYFRTSFTRRTRTTAPFLAAAALLLSACTSDATTGPAPALRGAAVNAGTPLLRWAPAISVPAAFDFAVAPDGRIYAAGDVDGVFVTERGTLQWRQVAPLPADVAAASITVTPDGALYVGTTQSVLRSLDGGAT